MALSVSSVVLPSLDLAPSALLVIPCFRESRRLALFLPQLMQALEAHGEVRVLVVDDGSGVEELQATRQLVEQLRNRYGALHGLLSLAENRGKGAAVYAGWSWGQEHFTGLSWLGFVDADGACSAAEVQRLYAKLPSLPAAVGGLFATRVRMLGRRVQRLWQRHALGRLFATGVSVLLGLEAYDTQCGLKWLRSQAYTRVASRLACPGFAFDVELIAALVDEGIELQEQPIDWAEVPGGKVRLFRDGLRMGIELSRIAARRRQWQRSSIAVILEP